MTSHHHKYLHRNVKLHSCFLLFFIIQEISDCSVFNLNRYLLLSYSRLSRMIKRRAGEMAQWVKVFAAKIYDLNSIHMVEREYQLRIVL